jgi:hypothetical protein
VIIGHLEIPIIAKKEETVIGQVKKQSNELFFDSSGIIQMEFIPEGETEQAMLRGDPSPSTQFNL